MTLVFGTPDITNDTRDLEDFYVKTGVTMASGRDRKYTPSKEIVRRIENDFSYHPPQG